MSKTLQTISPDHTTTSEDFKLLIINKHDDSESREYGTYEDREDLDYAKNNSADELGENEEFKVEYTGPEVTVENLWISKKDGTGELVVEAEFQVYDEDGEIITNTSSNEYIDVDSGHIDTFQHGLMHTEPQWETFDVEKVQEAINELLQEYPIDQDILEDAREQYELNEAFEYSHLSPGRDSDAVAVDDANVFATSEGVHISFNVITKQQNAGDDFPTYEKSSMHFAQLDIETGSLKSEATVEGDTVVLSDDIKDQLDIFIALPETQTEIEKATVEHIELKHIQDVRSSIKNGEAEIIKVDIVECDHKLATETLFVVKENDSVIQVMSVSEIDLETGASADTDSYADYTLSYDLKQTMNSKLNDYLTANPVSNGTLQFYEIDAQKQQYLAAEFSNTKLDEQSDVAVTNLHVAITSDKEVVANFDIISRQQVGEGDQEYRYTQHDMLNEKLDIDKKSVAHKSQSSLDYGSYDHDQVRAAVNKQIEHDDVLSDKVVASIKSKIDKLDDRETERVRMVAS